MVKCGGDVRACEGCVRGVLTRDTDSPVCLLAGCRRASAAACLSGKTSETDVSYTNLSHKSNGGIPLGQEASEVEGGKVERGWTGERERGRKREKGEREMERNMEERKRWRGGL